MIKEGEVAYMYIYRITGWSLVENKDDLVLVKGHTINAGTITSIHQIIIFNYLYHSKTDNKNYMKILVLPIKRSTGQALDIACVDSKFNKSDYEEAQSLYTACLLTFLHQSKSLEKNNGILERNLRSK